MAESIRIANAGGYWGDDLSQLRRQVELGPVDFVTLDFLAQIEEALPALTERGVRVISNAGGVNPLGCRGALMEMAQLHQRPLEVAAVAGDDLLARLGELNAGGAALDDMDTGAPFTAVRDRV